MIKWIIAKIKKWRQRREYNKRIAEIKKRDPFTYKNF